MAKTSARLNGNICYHCSKPFARKVDFCPFCGGRQQKIRSLADENKNEITSQPEQQKKPAFISAPILTSASPPAPAVANASGQTFSPADLPTTRPPAPASLQKTTSGIGQDSPPTSKPNRNALYFKIGVAVIILGAAISHFFGGTPPPIALVVQPGQWKAIDLGNIPPDSAVAISADGPFRVRSNRSPPLLVDGGQPVDLGKIARQNFEIKTATDQQVHIEIQVRP